MITRQIPLLFLLLLCIPFTQAGNWQWLRNTGLESLTDTDWKLLSKTLDISLENARTGEVSAWENQQSGNQGSIEILPPLAEQDPRCRRIKITTATIKEPPGNPLLFCKNAEGNWLIDSLAPTKGTPP